MKRRHLSDTTIMLNVGSSRHAKPMIKIKVKSYLGFMANLGSYIKAKNPICARIRMVAPYPSSAPQPSRSDILFGFDLSIVLFGFRGKIEIIPQMFRISGLMSTFFYFCHPTFKMT